MTWNGAMRPRPLRWCKTGHLFHSTYQQGAKELGNIFLIMFFLFWVSTFAKKNCKSLFWTHLYNICTYLMKTNHCGGGRHRNSIAILSHAHLGWCTYELINKICFSYETTKPSNIQRTLKCKSKDCKIDKMHFKAHGPMTGFCVHNDRY